MSLRFSSKTPDLDWLSNLSVHPFQLEGLRWPTVEHYYQAQKYAGTDAAEQIRRAESARRAMKLGRDRSRTPRADWERVKVAVMHRAIRAKFEQHPRLRQRLLATGDEPLVHASRSDRFWGQDDEGVGENRLGVLMMELRRSLSEAG